MTCNYPQYDIEFEIGGSYDTIDDAHKGISTALADWLTTEHGELNTILSGTIVIRDNDGEPVFRKDCHRMRLNRDISSDAHLIKMLNEHPQNVDETGLLIEKITPLRMPDPLSLMKLLGPTLRAELKAS